MNPSANPPPLSSRQTPPGTEVQWSTGLFSCFDDAPNSCGANAAIYTLIGFFTGCMGMRCYSCFYRIKMRKQYMLSESPCADCCVHCFCESCALCQEYRELKNRGFDMSKGWQGNVEKQQVELAEAPVVEEGMTR